MRQSALRQPRRDTTDELQSIPGVGPSIAQDLRDLGVRRVSDLKSRNPEAMYQRLCMVRGNQQDRCVLYVFRCAV
ncbi:MAG: helix-hairpin-helix domain-containing protein, partial [Gemmatimonadales bacterium]